MPVVNCSAGPCVWLSKQLNTFLNEPSIDQMLNDSGQEEIYLV